MKKVSVLGGGSWGTALAQLLQKNGHTVALWLRSPEKAALVKKTRRHPEYLPDINVNKEITVTADRIEAVSNADFVVLSVPSKSVREAMTDFKPYLKEGSIIVNTAKGFEPSTLMTMSEVIEETCPMCHTAVLSGPSHAEEVSREIPTAVVASSKEIDVAEKVRSLFMNPVFRVYTNTDIVGVELGGAIKNVIALAAGISDGMGFGDNSKAALMTRGIAEISRLGVAMGANKLTFAGLSGVGDLIATCTSMHSRNRRAGILLGQGKSLDETLSHIHMVVEGVGAAKTAYELSLKHGIEMPITAEIYKALFEGKECKEAVIDLMTREKTDEHADEFYLY